MKPQEIEALSFRIIDAEAGDARRRFTAEQWAVVRRMIHTSADFEYLESIRFHDQAVHAGIQALRSGTPVITDTRMAATGIRASDLQRLGGRVDCYIDDPRVRQAAAAGDTTRARAAVDLAAGEADGAIYAVGNAPTALLRLVELVRRGDLRPAVILGFPVGFVQAAESKQALAELDCPHITNVGRKGGSNVAAAAVNALILLAAAGGESG